MNTILEKIMELGAMEDRACSETERKLIINKAKELYNKHLADKSSMENINKIKCILIDFENNDKTLDETAKEILLLFGVSTSTLL